ncbi:G protein-regulated inducer of neurite outgrowth 3 [Bagarius yarrelli]|uniref:G protein-regulated inducer of neurite outgrowth 3 n=1 Tax=Bagarius yarrelli TaxID=175774 RepID=A0A556U035_BAGYA|nr:G protein-regulated inducer of neurite outgrowth 3 [Bagarius yarrelli]
MEVREERESLDKKEWNQIRSFKGATIMTEKIPVPVQTHEVALQTDLLYEDAEIQAVVKVSNKSTFMTPNQTRPSWSQTDSGQDASLDSGLAQKSFASVESMSKIENPTVHRSSRSSKPTRQHVCQIQIELCSLSFLSDSLALLEDNREAQGSSTRSGPETESGLLPAVAWDERGMTWAVHGAAVNMESLGFAVQNHLQRKIQEQEQHNGDLRKSVSLSEKRNVFRSLFQTSCCLKADLEA